MKIGRLKSLAFFIAVICVFASASVLIPVRCELSAHENTPGHPAHHSMACAFMCSAAHFVHVTDQNDSNIVLPVVYVASAVAPLVRYSPEPTTFDPRAPPA